MEWELGGRFKRQGTYTYLWLIHVDVWQKPTQYCTGIILRLKMNKSKIKKNQKTSDQLPLPNKHLDMLQLSTTKY